VRLRSRILAAAAVVAGVMAWFGIAAATALTNYGGFLGADPPAQMALLVHDPLLGVRVAWATLMLYWPAYLDSFIGRLGWFETMLPPAYEAAAYAMLGVAAVTAALGLTGERISVGSRLVMALGLLVTVAGVFASQYVIWTAPGHPIIDGVQGRYFLPLAVAGAALLPALGNRRWARLHDALVVVVALFPVVSLAVVMQTVVVRYYLQ
jgi:uncharacterized membrane protein